MVKVSIVKQGNYPVKVPSIKKKLASFFESHGIVSKAEVSVAIVGEAKMMDLVDKYLKDGKLHNVLSFTPDEIKGAFVFPPDGVVYLGEIVVCFPVALKEAMRENVLIDQKVYELIEHGGLHLLGIHHKE